MVLISLALLSRFSSPKEVNRKIQMDTRILDLVLHLCHKNLNLLLTPSKNTGEYLRRIRLNRLSFLDGLKLANLLQLWIFGPRAEGHLI